MKTYKKLSMLNLQKETINKLEINSPENKK